MTTVRLEPKGQVVAFCSDGYEPRRDLSGTPVHTRPMSRDELARLKSYSPYHRYHMGRRTFTVMFAMVWFSFAMMAALALLSFFGVVEKGSDAENTSILVALSTGLVLGLLWQLYYGRCLKRDFPAELQDVRQNVVLVQTINCHRAIQVQDINWDSRKGGLPWLLEVKDDAYIYLQGEYLDHAISEGNFPASSIEVARAPNSGWGLGLHKTKHGEIAVEELSIVLEDMCLDGTLLKLTL